MKSIYLKTEDGGIGRFYWAAQVDEVLETIEHELLYNGIDDAMQVIRKEQEDELQRSTTGNQRQA